MYTQIVRITLVISLCEMEEFLTILISAPVFGRFVMSSSILIGGFLGASGAMVGWSILELVQEFKVSK